VCSSDLQGFFVVSGFLVTMSYDRSRSLISYARKRARRILPAYVAVVLGAAVLLVAMSRLPWSEYFSHPEWRSYVFWNLLLANFTSPDLPGVFQDNYKQAINGSLWTIKIEVAFYCMVPVFAYLCGRAGKWRVLAMLLVASLAWRLGFELVGRMTDNGFWSKLAIQAPGQFAFFIAGAIAYERTRDGLPPPQLWMAVAAAAAYALSSDVAHELVAPIAVGIIVYWAAIAAPYVGRASRYGDFSYGIYLYHWPVIQTFIALGLFAASPSGAAFVAIATVLALAICSWYLLERRFLVDQITARAALETGK
jgi:peptidoglycan/LPS O-acetylase OafA/YrhL